jgi:3-phosphoshikimate 1-carboxyvinyltransferase
MNIKVFPGVLSGEVKAITSKSAAHRALICAFLCADLEKPPEIKINDTSKDIETTKNCLAAMKNSGIINCGESGSTFRFLLPLSAVLCNEVQFIGEGRLPERPIADLLDTLRKNGVNFSAEKLPFTVSGRLKSGVFRLPGNISSQFVSGLLFALPLLDGGSVIELTSPLESKAYADMTVNTLRDFGIEITQSEGNYIVKGNQKYAPPKDFHVENDWSNAAFFLAANLLGGNVKVTGLDADSAQGDREIVSILKRFETETNIEIDVSEVPDLLPILAVAGACTKGTTTLYNAARLRMKESDRLSAVCEMLKSLGAQVEEKAESLVIHGTGEKLHGGVVDGKGDHRIVMSAAICACYCENEVLIKGAEAADKSYPRFFADYEKLGGSYVIDVR